MISFQFLSGLNTIGANILDVQSETGRVIFDFGDTVGSDSGRLPDFENSIENTAIFISHLHIDHIGSLNQVPAEIPVFISKESYELYQLLVDIGEEVSVQASIYPLEYNVIQKVGDIELMFKKSDHDIKGASALFIQAPDVKLIHSGDVRLTGNYPENVEQWLEDAKAFEPDALLLEGTVFSFEDEPDHSDKNISERHMYEKWHDLVNQNSQEAILVNTYIRDIDRLWHLSEIVKDSPRQMVIEPHFAYLLEQYLNYSDFFVLKKLDNEEYFKEQWIELSEVTHNPGNYVLQNSFSNKSLILLFKGGSYCHSNGEPLGDFDQRYQEFIKLIDDSQLNFLDYNVSGHASKEDLIKIAKSVDATYTIPWHSFKPESLKEVLEEEGLQTFLPQRDVQYSLEQLNNRLKSDE